jgi:hypothetical protein
MFLGTMRSSERRSELQSTRTSIDTPFFENATPTFAGTAFSNSSRELAAIETAMTISLIFRLVTLSDLRPGRTGAA